MLSQLGHVFKTTFRQAESADTRQEIRREEKEDGRKKKDRESQAGDESALWDDSMQVSVAALHGFLVEFLKSHGAPVPQKENLALGAETAPRQEERPPASPAAARAVKAYTAMAPAQAAPPPLAPDTGQAELHPADLLSAEEIRTIHALIADIDALGKSGIQTLNITLTGTFLESLVEAVRLTKTGQASS